MTPNCKCHGEPTRWHKDNRRKTSGYWRCTVKERAAENRRKNTEKRRDTNARSNATRMFVGDFYIGKEHQFPMGREAIIAHLSVMRAELLARQAAEKEAFREAFYATHP